jgi:hypothetical protein
VAVFALVTVIEDYVRLRDAGIEGIERDRIVEALPNALTPDANALIGDHPPAVIVLRDGAITFSRSVSRAPPRPGRGVRALSAGGARLLAALVAVQLLAQRPERHGRRRAPSR